MPYTYTYGSGTENDPYQVWTVADLNGVRDYLDAHFIQMADIDLSGIAWEPIWDEDLWLPFSGFYNGQNFKISNFTYIGEGRDKALFYYIDNNAEFYNVNIEDINIDGRTHYAGLSIYAYNSYFENVRASGNITCRSDAGGLFFWLYGCNLKNVHSRVNFSGKEGYWSITYGGIAVIARANAISCTYDGSFTDVEGEVGGIFAVPHEAFGDFTGDVTIEQCSSRVNITGKSDKHFEGVGAFFGYIRSNDDGNLIVKNCYTRGSITGPDDDSKIHYAGGFVGNSWSTLYATFENCYSAVELYEYATGGFIGDSGISGHTVTNCYYDKSLAANQSIFDGYALPRTTAQMVYPYTAKHASGTYVDWEFEEKHITDLTNFDFVFGDPEIWLHDHDFSLNDGYPILFRSDILISKCIPFLFKVPYWE